MVRRDKSKIEFALRSRLAVLLAIGIALGATGASAEPPPLSCDVVATQGGAAVCRTAPGSKIWIGGVTAEADASGAFVVGFDRDAPEEEQVLIESPKGEILEHTFSIRKRHYDVSKINGLPPSQVNEYSDAQLARIAASSKRKAKGDASRAAMDGFADRFEWPFQGRKTSGFGVQRVLNGTPKRPHYGIDLAAPKGTAIHAPADGVVTLADEDLYFEGAMIVLDHGQGFLSKYLHVSRIDVQPGEKVKRGDVIGAVGSRGRSTGPHLCWRLKWRDRNLDPELWVSAPAQRVP